MYDINCIFNNMWELFDAIQIINTEISNACRDITCEQFECAKIKKK